MEISERHLISSQTSISGILGSVSFRQTLPSLFPCMSTLNFSSEGSGDTVALAPIHARTPSTPLPTTLRPEQRRAVDVLLRHLQGRVDKHHTESLRTGERRERIILSDEVTFLDFHATALDLPSANGWYWSQTKAKEELYFPESSTTVKFWKVISRSRGTSDIPNYKVWLFQISGQQRPSTVVWCEKGRTDRKSVV